MPIDGFNIGKEVSLDLVHPTLGIIPFGLLAKFEARPMTQRITSNPITEQGRAINRLAYQGWEGSFEIDRSNGVWDALIAGLEANYFNGNPETYFLLNETIRNPDGSIDEYRYRNVVLEPESAGEFMAEQKVTMKINFVASQRVLA